MVCWSRSLTLLLLGGWIQTGCQGDPEPVADASADSPRPDSPEVFPGDTAIDAGAETSGVTDVADVTTPSDPLPSDAPPVDLPAPESPDAAESDAPVDAGPPAPDSNDAASDPPSSIEVSDDTFPPGACLEPHQGCPATLAPDHLRLWLRGDVGRECGPDEGGVRRLALWRDYAGGQRHARPPVGKLGPTCGDAGRAVNGRDVVFFPANVGKETEEHLEVDLAPIVGKSFTIAVVEKRAGLRGSSAYVLGARLEHPDVVTCASNVNAGGGLQYGYPLAVMLRAGTWGPDCGPSVLVPADPLETTASMFVFQAPNRLMVLAKGLASEAEGPGVSSLGPAAAGFGPPRPGLIGRGYEAATGHNSGRYYGSIAEIVIFDVALDEHQRALLGSYLDSRWAARP